MRAEREALERQKAEQARRKEEEKQRQEAQRQLALAEAKRKQHEAAEAEARLRAEREALERQKADQAQREREDPNKVITHLTRVYQAGDLEGLVSLFTADAQVTGGRGKSYLRADYGDFFAQTPYRQLGIQSLRWQTGKEGRLIGRGDLTVRTRRHAQDAWHKASGSIHFELVPSKGGYKIARMEHTMR